MRTAIYARVSTLIGQSPEMQLAELREYAARRGWEVYARICGLRNLQLERITPGTQSLDVRCSPAPLIPHQCPQHADRFLRSKRALQQSATVQPLNPLAIPRVCLFVAPGHPRQLPCIHEQHLQTLRFQHLVRRNPINSCALHCHRLYRSRFQPLRHAYQFRRRRPEAGDFSSTPLRGRSAYPVPLAPQIDPGHVPSNHRQTLELSSLAFRALYLVFSCHLFTPTLLSTPAQAGRLWILT